MFEGYSSPHPCQHLVLLFLFKVSAGLHSLLRLQRRIHFSAFWAPQACPHSLAQSPCVLSLKLTPPNWVVLMLPLLCFYCLLFFFFECQLKKKGELRDSLVVQWLRLCTYAAGGTGSILGRGTEILHARWCSQKKKKIRPGSGGLLHRGVTSQYHIPL